MGSTAGAITSRPRIRGICLLTLPALVLVLLLPGARQVYAANPLNSSVVPMFGGVATAALSASPLPPVSGFASAPVLAAATDDDEGLHTLPQTPVALTSWQAQQVQGGFSGDPQVAASSTHVVVTARAAIGFFSKAGEPLVAAESLSTLFAPLAPPGVVGYFDARLIFDPHHKRFFMAAGAIQQGAPESVAQKNVLAVSKSENPLDGWYEYWWSSVPPDSNATSTFAADYPTIGIDGSNFYHTIGIVDESTSPRTFKYVVLSAFPADELVSGRLHNGAQWWDFRNADNSAVGLLQSVLNHDPGGSAFFANTYGGCDQAGGNGIPQPNLTIWSLADPASFKSLVEGNSVPALASAGVSLREFGCPQDAPQLGSTKLIRMTNLYINVLKAVERGGRLYLTMNDAVDWFGQGTPLTSVRLVQVDVGAFPALSVAVDRTFGGHNDLEDSPGASIYYGWGTAEVNKNGDLAVVYTRSGAAIFPQVRFSAFVQGEPDLRPSRLLKAGEDSYNLALSNPTAALFWGDLSGAAVDPYDDTGVWIAHQYTVSPWPNSNNYLLWIGKVFGTILPDFYVDGGVSFAPNPAAPGQQLNVSFAVHNQGDGGAINGPHVSVFLSPVSPSGPDVPLAATDLPGLAAAAKVNLNLAGTVPKGTATGTYRVKVVIDPANVFAEYDKTNNTALSAAILKVQPGPPATLALTPSLATNVIDTAHTVTAHVQDEFGNEVPNIVVRFAVTGANQAFAEPASGFATTDLSGLASFTYVGHLPGTDTITAFADTDNNGVRNPDPSAHEPQGTATKTWTLPASTTGRVVGGGTITDSSGAAASLALTAQLRSLAGELGGHLEFHAAARSVKGLTVDALVVSGSSAEVFGTASINGGASVVFRVDAVDTGEPGHADTFRLRLGDGYDSSAESLTGGNLQVTAS